MSASTIAEHREQLCRAFERESLNYPLSRLDEAVLDYANLHEFIVLILSIEEKNASPSPLTEVADE